jgi:hypothetical protein
MIRRRKKQREFFQMNNSAIQNKNLSFAARGLLAFLLSLPENFNVKLDWLTAQSDDSANATRVCLRELESENYLVRGQRVENGRISGVEWIFDDVPMDAQKVIEEEGLRWLPYQKGKIPVFRNSDSGNPESGIDGDRHPIISNTHLSNTPPTPSEEIETEQTSAGEEDQTEIQTLDGISVQTENAVTQNEVQNPSAATPAPRVATHSQKPPRLNRGDKKPPATLPEGMMTPSELVGDSGGITEPKTLYIAPGSAMAQKTLWESVRGANPNASSRAFQVLWDFLCSPVRRASERAKVDLAETRIPYWLEMPEAYILELVKLARNNTRVTGMSNWSACQYWLENTSRAVADHPHLGALLESKTDAKTEPEPIREPGEYITPENDVFVVTDIFDSTVVGQYRGGKSGELDIRRTRGWVRL